MLIVSSELVHFCWRRRDQDPAEAEIDLLMLPTDATFTPYTGKEASSSSDNVVSPTNGRIFVLKFSSSSQRYLFWLQSPSQHPDKQPNWFSPRDLKLGQIIDMMLSGEEVDVPHELSEIEPPNYSDRDEHPDTDNATGGNGSGRRGPRLRASSTGGAGAGASGGDFRDEGEGAREGGADGGRA
jgi:26S proteasome regulatory subunit N13